MRDTYYFFYEVFDGSTEVCFIYKIKFVQKVTKQYFQETMQLAKVIGRSYAALTDKDFQNLHLIKSVEELKADWRDYKECY